MDDLLKPAMEELRYALELAEAYEIPAIKEAIGRAISALSQSQLRDGAEGWRPIESAPKDGREILVCRFGLEDEPSYNVVYWDAYEHEYSPLHSWAIVESGSYYHNEWPTHWQPLNPPPPSPAEPKEEP